MIHFYSRIVKKQTTAIKCLPYIEFFRRNITKLASNDQIILYLERRVKYTTWTQARLKKTFPHAQKVMFPIYDIHI